MNKLESVKFIIKCQTRMRSTSFDPTWEAYEKQGVMRGLGLDPVQVEHFERLWRIIYDIMPNPRDQRGVEYMLVYLASLEHSGISPNPSAFDLTAEEANVIHAIIKKHS